MAVKIGGTVRVSFPAVKTKAALREKLGKKIVPLTKNPKLLLCDEPTGALDYKTGKSILKLLQDMARNENMTVVIITHNGAIAPMADKVISFKNGIAEKIEINENPLSIELIEW